MPSALEAWRAEREELDRMCAEHRLAKAKAKAALKSKKRVKPSYMAVYRVKNKDARASYMAVYRVKNKDAIADYHRRYNLNHRPERSNEVKLGRQRLRDSYVASTLRMRLKDIPPDLLKLKREQLQLHRDMNQFIEVLQQESKA